ncbi:Vitamin B12 transporter BtuB [Sinobacterium norvegicum]|uniref:Vitamin B12 transporter BtuB n=1 Tax=Sinobacterium norvegicum TaxID=1641715 RepID=A0ABN8ECP8_9GAMM|nr:TonB-dependent receptor [Sinobacterium norvegicum]CAH0990016.1 Vitamin B12 transporter BtuB [Sinobacterium norvegicum]
MSQTKTHSLALGVAALLSPLTVTAQVEQTQLQLEEVIVTATKREENLSDVAMSINTLTDQTLKEAGLTNFNEIGEYVPNLKIQTGNDSRSTSVRIRGIGSIGSNAGIDPSVGMFVDGVYMSRAGMSINDLTDIQRVEVLKGPQGTLYGKNTAAGAISVITKNPTEIVEADLELTAGNYGQQEVRWMANTPVTENTALRLSGYRAVNDGYGDNKTLNEDVNATDKWGVRGKFSWSSETLGEFILAADYAKEDSKCCDLNVITYDGPSSLNATWDGLAAANPGTSIDGIIPEPHEYYGNVAPSNEVLNKGMSLEWSKELKNEITLTWLNAYRQYESTSGYDGDLSPFDAVEMAADVGLDQFTSEFRIASASGEFLEYQAGLFYYQQDMDTDDTFDLHANGAVGDGDPGTQDPLAFFTDGTTNYGYNNHQTTSYSAFGQMTLNLTETVSLTAGLRWNKETKDREGSQISCPFYDIASLGGASNPPGVSCPQKGPYDQLAQDYNDWYTSIGSGLPPVFVDTPPVSGPPSYQNQSRTTTNWTPSINVKWHVTDDAMLYASFSRGYKSGGFNQLRTASDTVGEVIPGFSSISLDTNNPNNEFKDEESTNYELGMKSTWLNRRLAFNTSLYWTDYDEFQAQTFEGGTVLVQNAGSMQAKGVEFDITYLAHQYLTVGLSSAYNRATYGDYKNAPATVQQIVDNGIGYSQDLTGQQIDNAPKWTASSFAQSDFPIFDTSLNGFARLEYNYTSSYYLDTDLDDNLIQDDAGIINARLGIANADDTWGITIWGKNLSDEAVYVMGTDLPVYGGYMGALAPPRTYGTTFRYHYQ